MNYLKFQPVASGGGIPDTNLQAARQTVTLVQPMRVPQANTDTQNINQLQQLQPSFPTGVAGVVFSNGVSQPTQYVVQTPVSFVQSKLIEN